MITQENIAVHELVGISAEVVESANPYSLGMRGRIVNETKSTLTLDTGRGPKMLAKDTVTLRCTAGGAEITLNGSNILKRPFERMGKRP